MPEAALADLDPSGQDDEGSRGNHAGDDEAFAGGIGFMLAEAQQPIDFRRRQYREHLITSGLDDRLR